MGIATGKGELYRFMHFAGNNTCKHSKFHPVYISTKVIII